MYNWVVSYDGSTFVHPERGWIDVRVNDVKQLLVYDEEDSTKHYVVNCQEGMRPIFYYTVERIVTQRLVDGTLLQEEGGTNKITCFGWQKTVNGTNVKSLIRIHPDGSIWVGDHDPLQ